MRKTIIAIAVVVAVTSIMTINVHAAKKLTEDEVYEIAIEVANEYPICPELLVAMAFYESTYRPGVKNGSCMGLLQVSERWHKDRMNRIGAKDLYNPLDNMRTAADYICELCEEWDDIAIALMVYNGDSSAQDAYDGKADISKYAKKILKLSAELEEKHGKV